MTGLLSASCKSLVQVVPTPMPHASAPSPMRRSRDSTSSHEPRSKRDGDVNALGLNQDELDSYDALDSPCKSSIRQRAGQLKSMTDNQTLRMRILQSNLPIALVKELWEKLGETARDEPKLLNWVRAALCLPLHVPCSVRTALETTRVSERCSIAMESCVVGNEHVKSGLLRLIRMRDAKQGGGFSVALSGPPGIGKTTLARAAFEALDLPFFSIPLNGVHDAAYLRGSCYVYEGSMPGKIAQCLQSSKSSNAVFFFDEVDKLSRSARGDEISPVLMSLTDPMQNNAFEDKYFHGGIQLDLSKCIFVFALNDKRTVHPVLLDRLHVLEMEPPSTAALKQILQQVTVPRICTRLGLNTDAVRVHDDAMGEVCQSYSRGEHASVRMAERQVETAVSDKYIGEMVATGTWPAAVDVTQSDMRVARPLAIANNARVAVHSMFT